METELPSSNLGTKEHWDTSYAEELENFHSHGDPGEIWFSHTCQQRLVHWVKKNISRGEEKEMISVLDIGCGNGALLIELAKEGFRKLTGVDYSPAAIELAKQVANRDLASPPSPSSSSSPNIQFLVADFLDILNSSSPLHRVTFDLCLDKGTYDAISLDPVGAGEKRARYVENVTSLLGDDGVFLITSCNWTKDELCGHFSKELVVREVIPAPSFQFGGQTGQTVTTVAFVKQSSTRKQN